MTTTKETLPRSNFEVNLNKPVGKVIDNYVVDNYVERIFLNDRYDGSGLNTSENSKDSHPLNSGGLFE